MQSIVMDDDRAPDNYLEKFLVVAEVRGGGGKGKEWGGGRG